MADARKDKRTLLSLKIRYKSASLEDFIERYSCDISRGGVFIKAKKPLAVGTLLKFEFMLQDESTLIHGVGRVVWRREEADADAQNPSGMGIKFIKMDAGSRAVVQKISEDRQRPGVFEQGKEGERAPQLLDSDPADEEDQTKVRHVSEFLASALEEGGAGEVAQREAKQARQVGADKNFGAARGAFSAQSDAHSQQKHSGPEVQTRGAMSAFGGAGVSTAARISSAAAPAFDEFDPEDDFLENETTKVHDYPQDSYRPDAAATVIAKDATALLHSQRLATPVVPADTTTNKPLQGDVPDLFGPAGVDSFGPGAEEMIDARLFDSDSEPGRAPVPEAPGIPSEAFKVPQAPEPVWTMRPAEPKKARPWLLILLVAVVALAGAVVVAWQLGFIDGLIESIAPKQSEAAERAPVREPVAAPVVIAAEELAAEAPTPDETAEAAAETQGAEQAAAEATATEPVPEEAADGGMMNFEVTSVPSGAFVTVNGKRAGRTPVQLEHEVGTKLSIYSKMRGHLGQRQQVQVAAGQESVSFKLVPLPYVAQIVTSPAGAMASAVGGGVVTTPGELQFKSMPRSRKVVIVMDGYETANVSLMRRSFTEETRRMFATLNVSLKKEGSAASAEPAAPAPTQAKSEAEPPAAQAPSEAEAEPPAATAPPEAKPEPPAAPKAVEEAPAPSETAPADAP